MEEREMTTKEERQAVGAIIDTLQSLNDDQRQRVFMATAILLRLPSVLPLESKDFRLVRNV
jgi:hypothetical protein